MPKVQGWFRVIAISLSSCPCLVVTSGRGLFTGVFTDMAHLSGQYTFIHQTAAEKYMCSSSLIFVVQLELFNDEFLVYKIVLFLKHKLGLSCVGDEKF